MPFGVSTSMVMEPSIRSCAYRSPSTRDDFWLIRAATSSVELIRPWLISIKCICPFRNASCISSSWLLILPTVVMAKLPRCDWINKGWGSLSEIHPIP